MFGRKKLQAEIARLESVIALLEDERRQVLDMLAEKQRTSKFHAAYTFSDHDLQRYGNDKQGMQKNAVRAMSEALGRRIVRNLKADEVVEDGVLVGFKIEVEARKV